MPNIKVIQQVTKTQTGVTGTLYGDTISLDGALTVSALMSVTAVSSPSGASAVFQVSNKSSLPTLLTDWADYGSSQNITVTGNLFFEKINPTGNYLRVKFVIASGSFSTSTDFVVKGPN